MLRFSTPALIYGLNLLTLNSTADGGMSSQKVQSQDFFKDKDAKQLYGFLVDPFDTVFATIKAIKTTIEWPL